MPAIRDKELGQSQRQENHGHRMRRRQDRQHRVAGLQPGPPHAQKSDGRVTEHPDKGHQSFAHAFGDPPEPPRHVPGYRGQDHYHRRDRKFQSHE